MKENYEAAKKRMQQFVAHLGYITDDMREVERLYLAQIAKVIDDDASVQQLLDAFFDYIIYDLELCFNSGINEAIDRTNSDEGMAGLLTTILIATGGFSFSDVASYHKDILKQEIDYFKENDFKSQHLVEFCKDPLNFVLSRKKDINDFKSKITSIKQGISYKIDSSLDMLSKYIGIKAYDHSLANIWERNGIGYYIAYRGSDYDCPLCDSYCNKIYSVRDMHFPIHPRCCCVVVEVSNPETILGKV